jgi:4-hydroxy-4-methyl-2-oxoglutarate aldolase
MPTLTRAEIDSLRQIDSPTISNAIEAFGVRPRVDGFASWDLRCAFPELGSMVGYAVTCTADSTSEAPHCENAWMRLWDALEAAPRPSVVVIKDVGPDRPRSAHMGEVMATIARALGAVGCVSDGGLRDVFEVKAIGFQYFCPGFVVSHGNPVICDVNVPVRVCGLDVKPGDLLHGDANGLLMVPHEIASRVVEEAQRVREIERKILDLARGSDFTVAKLRELRASLRH